MVKDKQKWALVSKKLQIKYFDRKVFNLHKVADTKKESDRQLKKLKAPKGRKYRRLQEKGYYLIYISDY